MTTQARIERIERSTQELIRDIQQLPADVLYRAPQPGEWPVMSTLAHVAELLPYWAHEAESIARTPGQRFGRTHDDPRRIGAVDDHGRDSLDAIVPQLHISLAECLEVLRALPAEAWSLAGQHPRRGSMTIEQLVDDFLVTHVEEHAAQIKATLQSLAAARH